MDAVLFLSGEEARGERRENWAKALAAWEKRKPSDAIERLASVPEPRWTSRPASRRAK
jgi:hypothetical protein